MNDDRLHVVTGAYGYTGRYIANALLNTSVQVRTLTNSVPDEGASGGRVEARPLDFDEPESLVDSLRGADVLYNTYWVRFNHKRFSHADAVRNSKVLFGAAVKAGVKRIVHVSITNPSIDSPFEYFRGKAELEAALKSTGISYAILRPAVFFGGDDILINNIAWMLRRFPVFGLFGDGQYGIRPIHVEDFASLAVEMGGRDVNIIMDAVGPENFTYRGLVEAVGEATGCRRPLMSLPPAAGLVAGWIMGAFMRDVVITREEVGGLMAGLLESSEKPTGNTNLTDWAEENRNTLGRIYASELARRKAD
jgi:NADH dehydrogenase